MSETEAELNILREDLRRVGEFLIGLRLDVAGLYVVLSDPQHARNIRAEVKTFQQKLNGSIELGGVQQNRGQNPL
jgi:hypothetical protein